MTRGTNRIETHSKCPAQEINTRQVFVLQSRPFSVEHWDTTSLQVSHHAVSFPHHCLQITRIEM